MSRRTPEAATPSAQTAPQLAPLNTVGRDVPRIDALERVTGRATYTRDIRLPGMLYARVLTSPHPHARIRSIDVSRARALPGVRAIITHETHRVVYGCGSIGGGAQYSDEAKDATLHRRYMFDNPVRHVGEAVAAVAAIDRHTAEEAVRLITVDYEELPFVLDVEEALEPGAPQVWPEGNLALDVRNQPRPLGGRQGDPEAGFAAADEVFEDRYTTRSTFGHAYASGPESEPERRRNGPMPLHARCWMAVTVPSRVTPTRRSWTVCQRPCVPSQSSFRDSSSRTGAPASLASVAAMRSKW